MPIIIILKSFILYHLVILKYSSRDNTDRQSSPHITCQKIWKTCKLFMYISSKYNQGSFFSGSIQWYTVLTYSLTPWCRALLEQLTGLQLVKKFPAFHGTRRFITALTSVRHLSLSWASPIQSTSHLLEIHPNIIHPSMPRSLQWSPSLRFPHQDPIHPPLLTHMFHMPSPSHSRFYHLHNIGWGVQNM